MRRNRGKMRSGKDWNGYNIVVGNFEIEEFVMCSELRICLLYDCRDFGGCYFLNTRVINFFTLVIHMDANVLFFFQFHVILVETIS